MPMETSPAADCRSYSLALVQLVAERAEPMKNLDDVMALIQFVAERAEPIKNVHDVMALIQLASAR